MSLSLEVFKAFFVSESCSIGNFSPAFSVIDFFLFRGLKWMIQLSQKVGLDGKQFQILVSHDEWLIFWGDESYLVMFLGMQKLHGNTIIFYKPCHRLMGSSTKLTG